MQAEPSSSSPKRSVSDEPSQDAALVSTSQGPTTMSTPNAHNADIDAYMAEQGDDPAAVAPDFLLNPAQRLATVDQLCKTPLSDIDHV